MASLTPLSKGLIALAVVGGMASAIWHLALKDYLNPPADVGATATIQEPSMDLEPPQSEPLPQAPMQPDVPAATKPDPMPAPSAVSSTDPNADTMTGRSLIQKGEFAQARPYLERAVKNGSGAAACLLGEMTLQGQGGIPANQDAAARLFQQAQSHEIICFAPGQ